MVLTTIKEELPVRFAHRVKDLQELPGNLSDMPSIIKVKNWYAQSFDELVSFPQPHLPDSLQRKLLKSPVSDTPEPAPATPNPSLEENALLDDGVSKTHLIANSKRAEHSPMRRRPTLNYGTQTRLDGIDWPADVIEFNNRFTRCLERIKHRHDGVVTTIAQGVLEYKRAKKNSADQADLQVFLDRFYMSRIGIRMLIGQHIALGRACMAPKKSALNYLSAQATKGALSDVSGSEPEEYVGVICTNTNVGAVAHEAIENSRFVCEEHYGLFRAPPVQLVCPKNLTFMYVPSHLNHMLFELLKNSLRAVVERYGVENEDHFPPIKVIVVEAKRISRSRSATKVVAFPAVKFRKRGRTCIPPRVRKIWTQISIRPTSRRPWLALVTVFRWLVWYVAVLSTPYSLSLSLSLSPTNAYLPSMHAILAAIYD